MNLEEGIFATAQKFQRAIELSRPYLPREMRSFPLGQCGTAVRLLGAYLEDAGFGAFDYATGGRLDPDEQDEEPYSHAWLEKDGLIVDITADQFAEKKNGPVIVTRNLRWHGTFDQEVEKLDPASFRNLTKPDYLQAVYQLIQAQMELEKR